MVPRERPIDDGAPVAALSAEAIVPELLHQLSQHVGHALGVVARLGRLARKAITGQGRDDDVEGIRRVSAVGSGVGQWTDQVRKLHERAGPAVHQQERHRVLVRGPFVDEVHVDAVDVGLEVVELVEPSLLSAPVESVLPIG